MYEDLGAVLAEDPRIAYALVFGSSARGTMHAGSDVDVAVGTSGPDRLDALAIGGLISRLEEAAGTPVDLVLLDEAPPGLAYRVFRDGQTIFVRDRRALVSRRAAAILEYLDFRPFEEFFTRSVLAADRGR
jgi:predicted nucleotidyltransferase